MLLRILVASMALSVALVRGDEFPPLVNSEPDKTTPFTSPSAAVEAFELPDGFTMSLFAAEPDVQNPVAMAWDQRGRMWVAENYTYAERSKRFDLSMRDRVIILEDADHDGKAERRTVFTDKVQMLSSVEWGRGGVWLLCPPQLLFISDNNGDDVPDSAAQVVLDGFLVAKDNYHNFANGLRWGPDGWLYGRCGHSCPASLGLPGTPEVERVPMKGGIWRFHPERKIVEVLTHGTTNPWGHDWDAEGELFFINTVTGHLWHLMPGAHLHDTSPSLNPQVFHRLDTIADHYHYDRTGIWSDSRDGKANHLGGGHAHVGMMIYQGRQWPANYQNKLFTLNMHGRRANVERLERSGSGYVGKHEPDVFITDDPWFRGIEISTGPDDSGYILDWSDIGECHESTGVHRTSGRVYRVSYGKPNAPSTVRYPRCVRGNGPLPRLWNDYQTGKTTPEELRALLTHPDEALRVWAIRLLTDFWPIDTMVGPRKDTVYPNDAQTDALFLRLAASDASSRVHLALASTLQRLPLTKRLPLAKVLASHSRHAEDTNLPLMVWFGLMPLAENAPMGLVEVAASTQWPRLIECIARSLATQMTKDLAPLEALLVSVVRRDASLRLAVLTGLSDGTRGWRKASKPPSWNAFSSAIRQTGIDTRLQSLDVIFGDGVALAELHKLVLDESAEITTRQSALRTLIETPDDDLRRLCEQLLRARGLNVLAAQGLGRFSDPAAAELVVKAFRSFPAAERPTVVDMLVSRPVFAKVLLEGVAGRKAITRADISAFQARQILSFGDKTLTELLTQVWGEIRESAAEKEALFATWKTKLSPAVLAKANLSNGRALFGLCAGCHQMYGQGGKIGPDLTGSGRAQLDYLLENILDPSAVVSADYRLTTLSLKDGRVLGGMVSARSGKGLTINTMTGEVTVLEEDIVKQQVSPQSMMPEGLLQALTEEQVRDLIGYLMHPTQVAQ